MNNQQYVSNMPTEQKHKSQIEGTAGILIFIADLIARGNIVVNPDTLHDDGKMFSFIYRKVG